MGKVIDKTKERIQKEIERIMQRKKLNNDRERVINTIALDYYMFYYGAVDIDKERADEIIGLGKEFPEWSNLLNIFYRTLQTSDFSKIKPMYSEFCRLISYGSEKEIAGTELTYALGLGDPELMKSVVAKIYDGTEDSRKNAAMLIADAINNSKADASGTVDKFLSQNAEFARDENIIVALINNGTNGIVSAAKYCAKYPIVSANKTIAKRVVENIYSNLNKIGLEQFLMRSNCNLYLKTGKTDAALAKQIKEQYYFLQSRKAETEALLRYLKTVKSTNSLCGNRLKINGEKFDAVCDKLNTAYKETQHNAKPIIAPALRTGNMVPVLEH